MAWCERRLSGAPACDEALPQGKDVSASQSENPGGRPKTIGPIHDLARGHSAAAIITLVTILQGEEQPGAFQVAARGRFTGLYNAMSGNALNGGF